MNTKDQAIALATQRDYYEQACERLAADLKAAQAPDCRTCWYLHTSDHGDNRYECTSKSVCTNGDKYQPAPAVVLWRTT